MVETHSLVESVSEMIATTSITTIDLTRPQQTIDGKWYVAGKKNARGCPRLKMRVSNYHPKRGL